MDSPSMSSTIGDQISRHGSDPFNEKKHAYEEPTSPTKAYIPGAAAAAAIGHYDVEKQAASHHSSHSVSDATSSDQISAARVCHTVPSEYTEDLAKTLLYLSTINPFISALLTLFTILSTPLILIFGLPSRLGKDSLSFQDQLIKVLAPAIRYELRLTSTEINLFSRSPISSLRLIGILLFSPLFSIGIALAAWTAGSFWFYTTILGEPNEDRGKEVDGKSAARWVKGLWVRWLLLGL